MWPSEHLQVRDTALSAEAAGGEAQVLQAEQYESHPALHHLSVTGEIKVIKVFLCDFIFGRCDESPFHPFPSYPWKMFHFFFLFKTNAFLPC